MPNTTERREIAGRANAKEAEIIQESKEPIAKTKRSSAIAGSKNLARLNQEQNDPPRVRKSMPRGTAHGDSASMTAKLATVDDHILAGVEAPGAMDDRSIVPGRVRDKPQGRFMQFDS